MAIGSLGAGEAVWHTDMSYYAAPPKASALYALEVPDAGGDTTFLTMYGAWEAIPLSMATASFDRFTSQARRHLQQRRLSSAGRYADR